jgi:hypothetical protein
MKAIEIRVRKIIGKGSFILLWPTFKRRVLHPPYIRSKVRREYLIFPIARGAIWRKRFSRFMRRWRNGSD